jgi:hypothetical protein
VRAESSTGADEEMTEGVNFGGEKAVKFWRWSVERIPAQFDATLDNGRIREGRVRETSIVHGHVKLFVDDFPQGRSRRFRFHFETGDRNAFKTASENLWKLRIDGIAPV